MTKEDLPYYELAEFSKLLGFAPRTAVNKIANETFPVKTYKLGKRRVADKAVVAAWFDKHRNDGLAALAKSTKDETST